MGTDNISMNENQNFMDDAQGESAPALPTFVTGEQKTANLTWEMVDGVMQVGIETHGFQDDLNQLAMMLSFTLEKLLDSAEDTPVVPPTQ